jgi:hypothetical protein
MVRIIALAVALALTTGAVSGAAPRCPNGKACGNACIAKGKACPAQHKFTPVASGPYAGLKYTGSSGH